MINPLNERVLWFKYHIKHFFLGLNMFLVPINISTLRFSLFKIFRQLLVPIKFSITNFGPYFYVNFSIL